MRTIYETDGPRWTDSNGEEQSGWPRDGFHLRLNQLGRDRFELCTERRHIDGDGLQEDRTEMTRADAIAWLLARTPVPSWTLERYFPEHREGAGKP